MVRAADIVVAGADFPVQPARRANPDQVIVTISLFGTSGPWVGRAATEFTLQAACGSTGGRGFPDSTPLAAGGRVGEWLTGTYAAVGALAAWWRADHTGVGGHVDVSVLDCMAIGMVTFPSVFAEFAASCGRPPMTASSRRIEVPSVEPTADGWVNFTTNSAAAVRRFLRPHRPSRDSRRRTLRPRDATVRASQRVLGDDEGVYAATDVSHRPRGGRPPPYPVAPVLDGATVEQFEQFVARGVFVDHPSGRFRQPRIPFRLHDLAPRPFDAVPAPGAHDGTVEWTPGQPREPEAGADALPLAGLRVVDLTAWWAGPCATQVLACLGADVIKVESVTRPDLMRFAGTKAPGDPQWWEWGPLAHAANTNKRGITLDLTRAEGHELALRLCATADVVFENFTPRVMEQFGLTWDRLHDINPELNMVRMPAFGLDGPWRDRPGFAQTMESLTGMAAATGWPGGVAGPRRRRW